MKNIIRISIVSVIVGVASLTLPVLVSARSGDLPEMMVGQTTLIDTTSGISVYGGMTGNEVVLNYAPTDDADPIKRFFGFKKDVLEDCSVAFPELGARCFQANRSSGAVKVMSSQTHVNGTMKLETASLFYHQATVSGDVYGDLTNFKFWGRNLHYSTDDSLDSTWNFKNVGGYTIADNSQSKWGGADFNKFLEKANTLYEEGAKIAPSSVSSAASWNLQSQIGAIAGVAPTPEDIKAYPEGKVWSVEGALNINRNISYSGTGTLIVKGSLTIMDGFELKPADDDSHLGIIVLVADTGSDGKCFFRQNVNIDAYAFCQVSMYVSPSGAGSNLTGAFVSANIYNISYDSFVGYSNMRFFYNPLTAGETPPGFRYLNLPTVEQ